MEHPTFNKLATSLVLTAGTLLSTEVHGRGPDPELLAAAQNSREAIANTGSESPRKRNKNEAINSSIPPLEAGPFVVKPHLNLITHGTLNWQSQNSDETSGEKPTQFSGEIAMLQARALAVTRPDALPNNIQVGAFAAGGWVGDNFLPLGKMFIKTPRVDLVAGQANDASSFTFLPPFLSGTPAGTKVDSSFYNLTPIAPNFDRFAKLALNLGPKQRKRLIQVFGDVRAGGLEGDWNPTGVVGMSYNDGQHLAATQFHFETGDSPSYFAEAQYRYTNIVEGTRFELSAIALTHSGVGESGERQNTMGGSAFAAVGVGEGLDNRSEATLYGRVDLGGELEQDASVKWNAVAGVSVVPTPKIPLSITPQISVRGEGSRAKNVQAGITTQVEF